MYNKIDDELIPIMSFLDKLPCGVVLTDINFKIIFINSKFEKLFGYSCEEVIGKDPIIFNAESEAKEIQFDIINKLSEGKSWSKRLLNRRKNGEIFVLDIDISSIENKDGKIIAYIGLQKDATAAEGELVKERDIAQRYLDIAGVIIVILDCDGKVVLINNKGCEVLGYEESEIVGKDWFSNFIPKDMEDDVRKLYEKVVNDRDSDEYFKNQNDIITKSGKNKTIEWTGTSFYNSLGDFEGFLSSGSNVTDRMNVEKSLRNTALDLARSNEELERFAYIASHDLQEPLRAVSSYCQLLKEKEYKYVDEESKKFFDYIIDSSLRMKTLIKELLDFSRVGRKDNPFEKINLQDLLEEVLTDFNMLIEDTGAEIIIENDMPYMIGIRLRMKQLFHNIISNSLKFKGEDKIVIRIGCCDDDNGNSLLFYIKDNGIGIESKYYDRIFGIFKRLYSREEYAGTGIGLALCKRIVEAHGGDIWVESEVGKGTYIYFTIPKELFHNS